MQTRMAGERRVKEREKEEEEEEEEEEEKEKKRRRKASSNVVDLRWPSTNSPETESKMTGRHDSDKYH